MQQTYPEVEAAIADIIASVTDEELLAMRRAAPHILAGWKLDASIHTALIGSTDRNASSYSDEEKLALVCITNVHAQLRLIFRGSDRAYRWMRASNAAFSGMSAVELIQGEGLDGLMMIFGYLTRVWATATGTNRSGC